MDHDQDCLSADGVSDEALERAATADDASANFTLGSCTGLSVCPSQ